jgi:cellulose synthase/poly-beta-1,6-N-acetylglucosamine synthase-like glycosyltransferase
MDVVVDILNSLFILVGTYFAVLFLLLFISHEKKMFQRPKIKNFPSVSIIIPAFNEGKVVEKTVEAVKKMVYPRKKEIIVVDDGSTDDTYKIAKKIRGIIVLRKMHGGKASSLNFGLRRAKGDIIVCIDSDSYPEKNALLKAIQHFEKGVAAVTTSVLIKNSGNIIEKLQELEYLMIAWSRKILEYLDAIYVTPGPMSLYKRKVILKIGGFDEKNLTEDIEIAWRLMKNKYKIKMALDTKVHTRVPNNLKKWWHQRIRWNVGGLQTFLKYFHLFLNKEFKNIGMFVLPVASISYVMTFVGLIFLIYLFSNWVQYIIGAYIFGFNPLLFSFTIVPDMFLFLFVFSALLTIVFLKINFGTMKKIEIFPLKLSNLFIYVFIYVMVFPLNLLHSFLKFLTGNYEW